MASRLSAVARTGPGARNGTEARNGPRARGGPGVRIVAALLGVALAVAGCGIAARGGPAQSPMATPVPSVPIAIDQARVQLEGALRAAGYFLERSDDPFRPPESGLLAAAPRIVYQVLLPEDPGRGQIVVYEFPDTERAAAGGREMAAYLASGPGRVQFSPDAKHVLRQLGTTLIFYTWSRGSGASDAAQEIATVLDTVGQGIAIPQ